MDAFQLAANQIGLNENEQNAALTEYLKNGGENLDPATTAWCAAFVNSTLSQSGGQGTGKLNARSYLDWGQEVGQPKRGDVAIFSRGDPNGWQGHVGFYDGTNEDGTIRVLGGNQSDSVSIANYSPSKLLGYRRANLTEKAAAKTMPTVDPHQSAASMPAPPNYTPEAPQQSKLMRMAQIPQLEASQRPVVNKGNNFTLRRGADGLDKFIYG